MLLTVLDSPSYFPNWLGRENSIVGVFDQGKAEVKLCEKIQHEDFDINRLQFCQVSNLSVLHSFVNLFTYRIIKFYMKYISITTKLGEISAVLRMFAPCCA